MVRSNKAPAQKRNLAACDQCHALKLKCVFLTHECARCKRLRIRCTSQRAKHKRGRKPKAEQTLSPDAGLGSPSSPESSYYPVLDCLSSFGVCWKQDQSSSVDQICSPFEASRLLEHFFTSPNQEFHARILRRRNVLDLKLPRATSPALLLSILCVACYMPTADNSPVLLEVSSGKLITARRTFLSQTLKLLQPVLVGEIDPTFDDAITFFMLSSIGASENDTHLRLPHWLSFMKYSLRKLSLYAEVEGLDEEEKEERRRLWWSGYTIDRHVALSFNLRPQTTDLECQTLQRPCPGDIWESDIFLEEYYQDAGNFPSKGITYSIQTLDLFGVLLPLSSITGDILEYHFLRQHATFGSHRPFMTDIRNNIEQNLRLWDRTLQDLLARTPYLANYGAANPNSTASSKVVLYGRHIWHCLHVLLFGRMDFVEMYRDLSWQASTDFVQAGEHAISCAKLAGSILTIDPHLQFIYRYFGTYLLQSSFIFLILAQKLGQAADNLILENCTINLRVLDTFVQVVNVEYQRTFARVLRQTLSKRFDENAGENEDLDPALLQYRWVAGYNGLWNEDMALKPVSDQQFRANGS
ncbi:uncharacterized protein PAC_13634 [Phialocephala subalpina]|uniref:Zn(2)-C6 fungal-type domain-containing protein n=1 Tax=Phialocephala subalpina TaxID=576137 RepID=A0A1L7XFM4_9HELO|nr:uncharacterized protein PAC_13634 [Phialocephala subalpina]